MTFQQTTKIKALAVSAVGVIAAAASGCGGGGGGAATPTPAAPAQGAASTSASSGASGAVLPVAKNPISNKSQAAGLEVAKVLAENNVSPETRKAVDDHLEVTLRNTSSKPLDKIAIYYKFTDPTKGVSEGYYAALDGFAIDAGASRVVHFDATGAPDHYPVNKYSLYYTDKNAMFVDVMASSPTVKPSSARIKKDAGGAEGGSE